MHMPRGSRESAALFSLGFQELEYVARIGMAGRRAEPGWGGSQDPEVKGLGRRHKAFIVSMVMAF